MKPKLILCALCILCAFSDVSAQEVASAGPNKAARYSALLNAKNLTLTTQQNTKYYYLVSANDNPVMHFETTPNGRYISIGPDHFLRDNIKSMRFQSLPRLFLNEDSTTHGTDYAVDHGLLVLRRSFRLGGWNTLVLPVNLTGAQVRELFGEGTTLARVRGAEGEDELTIEFDTIELDAEEYALSANVCYLIRPTREPDVAPDSRVSNVTSGRVAGPLYMLPNVSLSKGQVPNMAYIRDNDLNLVVRMRGTYSRLDNTVLNDRGRIANKEPEPGTWSFNEDGYIVENVDSVLMPAFRCWFQRVNHTKPLRFVINGVEDELNIIPTGLVETLVGRRILGGNVYDLQGRRIATLRDDERIESLNLPSGIYLVNGTKIFIK